jgi:hypothetical protein
MSVDVPAVAIVTAALIGEGEPLENGSVRGGA